MFSMICFVFIFNISLNGTQMSFDTCYSGKRYGKTIIDEYYNILHWLTPFNAFNNLQVLITGCWQMNRINIMYHLKCKLPLRFHLFYVLMMILWYLHLFYVSTY